MVWRLVPRRPRQPVNLGLAGVFFVPTLALAAVPAAAVDSPSPLMGLLQVVFGLAVVLGVIMGAAWMFRRFSQGMLGATTRLKVVSGVMVGQRERVVIVELEGEWLVLGVTPSQVNLLNKLPRPDDADNDVVAPTEPFARWLKAAMEKGRRQMDASKKP